MGRNAKKGANQHNAKHENGIVAPGKRVTKQKSNGHLGQQQQQQQQSSTPATAANGSTYAAQGSPPPPLPETSDNFKARDIDSNNVPVSSVPQSSITGTQHVSDTLASNNVNSGPHSQGAQNDSTSDDLEESDTMPGKASGQQQHRRIDVTNAKHASIQDGSAFHLALTVLRSFTIADTMAILVILLSLPPAVLHLTNAIFAMLTFVPPSGTFTTLPSLADITSSFSPGAPSFVVLILIDLIAICLWSIMPWPHLQTVLLDCAQATVATTLGGGYTFRPGSSDNLLLVITFVFATHLGRYRRTTLRWLHRTSLARYLPLVESLDDLPARPSYVLSPERSWFDTLKIWVALHILLQGLTRMVRRSLNAPREPTIGARNVDPEANTTSISTDPADSNTSGSHTIRSRTSVQNLREVKDKISVGKRRKKQANYVRSQQPLWAAIASTKARFMREYDQTQATKYAKSVELSDTQSLGTAPFSLQENKVWVTLIKSDKFYFETGPIRLSSYERNHDDNNEAGVDSSVPFSVLVNGAQWASSKAVAIQDCPESIEKKRWIGEIYGLSAGNTFKVLFLRSDDNSEIYSENIVTPASTTAEQVVASNAVIPPQALRPSSPASPIATVKASIAAFEAGNADLLASQKRIRKDSKALKAKLEKELENLSEKFGRVMTATKNITQRQTQLENSMKQTEEAIGNLSGQINDHGAIPEDSIKDWQENKTKWETIRNELSRVQEDVQRTKEENRLALTAVQTRELSERQKRDRAQTRVKKLTTDYAALQGPARHSDHNRANSAYVHRAAELDQKEAQAQHTYDALRVRNMELFNATQTIKHEIDYLEYVANQNDAVFNAQTQARLAHDSRPITPEGDLPGTNTQAPGSNHSVSFSRAHHFSTPEVSHAIPAISGGIFANGFPSRQNTVSSMNNRHRSQSALSGNSAYAVALPDDEDDDDDPIPLLHKRRTGGISNMREGSDGRSSSSGSPHVSAGAVVPSVIGAERRTSPTGQMNGHS